MHKRDQRTQITFRDKNIDRIISTKVHQIPTNTQQKELHHMDLQETIVLRIQRERERESQSHLATNYGPVGLQRTTHTSSERHQ